MDTTTTDLPRIVAVFGGNKVDPDVAHFAQTVADWVATSGGIVLSGGDGHDSKGRDVTDLNVRDQANAAARTAGRWISVLNTRHRPRDCLRVDSGLVVWPGIDDRRNFLESSLSDACMVLSPGAGDATLSELVSALCLGRPVLLLADPARAKSPWPAVHSWFEDGEEAGEAVADVLERTRGKLGGPEGVLGDLVRTSVTEANLRLTERCECQTRRGRRLRFLGRQAPRREEPRDVSGRQPGARRGAVTVRVDQVEIRDVAESRVTASAIHPHALPFRSDTSRLDAEACPGKYIDLAGARAHPR